MRWHWTRPKPVPEHDPPEDALTRRLRHLAEHYRRDPGVRPWADLLPARPVESGTGAPAEHARILPTVDAPLLTPAQQWRSQGGAR